MTGPMRLHASALTAHASGIAASAAGAAVADRTATVLQLRLAGRRLRQVGAAQAAEARDPAALAAGEWAAAAAVAAATLEAHLPAIEDTDLREQAARALQWLAAERCVAGALAPSTAPQQQQQQRQEADAEFLGIVEAAFGACTHPVLRGLWPGLAMPCLSGLLEATQGGAAGAGKCSAVFCRPDSCSSLSQPLKHIVGEGALLL